MKEHGGRSSCPPEAEEEVDLHPFLLVLHPLMYGVLARLAVLVWKVGGDVGSHGHVR